MLQRLQAIRRFLNLNINRDQQLHNERQVEAVVNIVGNSAKKVEAYLTKNK